MPRTRPPRSRLVRRDAGAADGPGHREILGSLVVLPDGCPTCAGTGELRGDRTEPCPECRGDRGRAAVAKRFREDEPDLAACIDSILQSGASSWQVLAGLRAGFFDCEGQKPRRVRRQVLAYLAEFDLDVRRELERGS